MIPAALLAAASLGAAAAVGPSALERAAQEAAERLAALAPPAAQTSVGVAVASPQSPELERAAQTALVAALTRMRFKAVLPLAAAPEAAEAEARVRGLDLLLRAAARVDGAGLGLAGDVVPTWVNFFAGRDPVRAPGGGPWAVRVAADAEAFALAHLSPPRPPPPEIATRFSLRLLSRLSERVVAVAVGDLDGDGRAEIALQLPTSVVVLGGDGAPLARREQSSLPRAARAPREPAGALAIAAAAGAPPRARLLSYSFALARGEALELDGGALKVVGGLEAPALASGAAGVLAGAALGGKNLFAPEVRLEGGPAAALPFAPVAVAASPRGSGPAFLAIAPDGAAVLLSAQLEALGPALPPLGAGAALGDLDGDGSAELVTSALSRTEDRARLWRADGAGGRVLFESEPVAGGFAAGAAGDLDGDGRDEAVLAAWGPDGSSTIYVLGAQR